MVTRLQRSSLFPYTTLFRSEGIGGRRLGPQQVPVDLEGDFADVPLGDSGVAFLREADLDVVHAIEEAGQACDLLLRSEEHTSELQSHSDLVCRLLLEKKKKK